MTEEKDELFEKSRMTLGEHLEELRRRLIRALVAVGATFLVAWMFHEDIAALVLRPLHQSVAMLNEYKAELAAKHPDEPWLATPISALPRGDAGASGFFFYMKVCFYFSLAVAGPYVLWEMWRFIAAGLYLKERKLVYRSFPFSALLFVLGILFGYFAFVPYGLYFIVRLSIRQVEYYPEVGMYLTFLTGLSLALGVVFQLPIVMFALGRLGLVDAATFSKYRGHFVVIALIIAAILTPPDPFTQLMMAVPMVVLYEVGIHMARVARRRSVPDSVEAPS